MKRLMNFFMLSCRKATELIEKGIYFKLSRLEKVRLRMHMLLCDFCTRYKKQSLFLHNLLLKHGHDHAQAPTLPEDTTSILKERIINQLEKQ